MKGFSIVLVILIIGSLMCCSSAPEQAEEVVAKKNSAAEYAEYGNSYYNKGMYAQALNFFKLSLSYNGAVYNEEGMVIWNIN